MTMRDDETYGDLARLFAAEDAKLEAAPFTADVMKRVRRQAMIRRLTVGAFGFLGALIALLQLPELLSAFVGVDHTVISALDLARTEISQAATRNPMWLAIIIGAALSIAAVSMTERA
ncbi:MAG: hypothetical protein CVT79_08525 [Alphaproteobacteria bacterium HGW-Alphaproteobacteria-18]|nr:MAG: hypothetical protein CVT79_08525 [Alphaproteobacteria bacterium HGW-Alphaproteobacteria-18]